MIKNDGSIISPFRVGSRPLKHRFIARNRLMVLWSDEIVVVEGGIGSGAMMTGMLGIDSGRRVFAVPSGIFSRSGDGCIDLMRRGAVPYMPGSGSICRMEEGCAEVGLSPASISVSSCLKACPMTLDELARTIGNDEDDVRNELMELEIRDMAIFRPDGKWHYTGW